MSAAYRPRMLAEALALRSGQGTLVLAGGTDLMANAGRLQAYGRPVLCVSHLEELRQIRREGDALLIGAACTLCELLESPLTPAYMKPPLAGMASPAIRNMATIGGNLCHASPAGDALPMLYALDAVLHLQSERDGQWVPVQDFVLGPGRTLLREDQLLCQIRVPLEAAWRCSYRKVGLRQANSLSKLSFYALSRKRAGHLRDLRLAFGAVAPTVVRSREAELEILAGAGAPDAALIERACARYGGLIQPIDDVRSSRTYRGTVALRLLTQYLKGALEI
ncbi:MAG: xanthine dehydrogenase family protein subunit M [Christensenellales bacterium]